MKKYRKFGIVPQMYILVTIAVVVMGIITFFTQYNLSWVTVKKQIESVAAEISEEAARAAKQYPAYKWLLRYWYNHYDEMDIEYDADFTTGTATKEKCMELAGNNPGFQISYATEEEVSNLSPEDQKAFAEIIYVWLLDRLNQIKQSYKLEFLYYTITETLPKNDPYQEQFFLMSAADPDSVRGTEYHQVYPIGTTVSVAEFPEIQKAMRSAVMRARPEMQSSLQNDYSEGHLAESRNDLDYYSWLGSIGDKAVLTGITYNVSEILEDIRTQTEKGTLYAVLYQAVMLNIILLAMFLFGIRPLKGVLDNIRSYTKDKDSAAVERNLTEILSGRTGTAIRHNEIGELAEDTITLAKEIDNYTNEIEVITAERERIGIEMGLASKIQSDMLPGIFPAFPDRDEFSIYASMDPARGVGGDFYDFFLIDDDHLALMIADVSGKGVPAALFMMSAHIVIRNMLQNAIDPAKALMLSNNEICRINRSEMFVTVWVAVLEISTGKLTCANGGHEYPAITGKNGRFVLFKDRHGLLLGEMDNIRYTSYEIQMDPGSKIFVYTDGVAEATNRNGELFGADRMIDALNRDCKAGPEDLLYNVREAVDEFAGDVEQFDDLTMLCLEYKPEGER